MGQCKRVDGPESRCWKDGCLSGALPRRQALVTIENNEIMIAGVSLKSAKRILVVLSLSCVRLLQPHRLQHDSLPCPSLSPWVSSCPLSQWCLPAIYRRLWQDLTQSVICLLNAFPFVFWRKNKLSLGFCSKMFSLRGINVETILRATARNFLYVLPDCRCSGDVVWYSRVFSFILWKNEPKLFLFSIK